MNHAIDRVLRQLAATFTVREIMVETEALTRANSKAEAQQKLAEHPRFDVIPLPATGSITAYFHRGELEIRKIGSSDLISDGTSLLDVPNLLSKRDFFFVLSSNTLAGFIHFSDLNKSPMKLPFFVLLEAVESHLWPMVSSRLNDAELPKVLDQQRVKTIKQRKEKAEEKQVNVGWSGLLSFDEILKFAIHYGITQIPEQDRKLLANIRNRVDHADKLLVEEHIDTAKLVKTHELCQKILDAA